MSQERKIVEPKRREIIPNRMVSIHAGKGGYQYFVLDIKTEEKQKHVVFFDISVRQPAGRQDLDINFFVLDEDNFEKWVRNAPNHAFIIAPRLTFGELNFSPPVSGRYYAILNNQYSVLTPKTVDFASYETWLEEKVEQKADQAFEVTVGSETQPRLLKTIYHKLRYSQTIGLVALLLIVQIACFLIAGLIMHLFHLTFGLEYKDIMGYIAASVGPSTLIILFALYYFRTGKPLSAATH